MTRNNREKYFFSMELNPEKQEDKAIIDLLESCGNYKKTSFVKAAIRAYAQQQELKAAICESVKEAFSLYGPLAQESQEPVKKREPSKQGKPYLQAANSFVEEMRSEE